MDELEKQIQSIDLKLLTRSIDFLEWAINVHKMDVNEAHSISTWLLTTDKGKDCLHSTMV